MVGLNKVMLIGNVGRPRELRYTESGKAVVSFSVAVNRSYTQNEQRHEETDWFQVVAWGKLAELCNEYLARGARSTSRAAFRRAPGAGMTASSARARRSSGGMGPGCAVLRGRG